MRILEGLKQKSPANAEPLGFGMVTAIRLVGRIPQCKNTKIFIVVIDTADLRRGKPLYNID